jgi:hypothetical protein
VWSRKLAEKECCFERNPERGNGIIIIRPCIKTSNGLLLHHLLPRTTGMATP